MSTKADKTALLLTDRFAPGDRVYHIAAPKFWGVIIRRHDGYHEAYDVEWAGSTFVSDWCNADNLRLVPKPRKR